MAPHPQRLPFEVHRCIEKNRAPSGTLEIVAYRPGSEIREVEMNIGSFEYFPFGGSIRQHGTDMLRPKRRGQMLENDVFSSLQVPRFSDTTNPLAHRPAPSKPIPQRTSLMILLCPETILCGNSIRTRFLDITGAIVSSFGERGASLLR